MRDGLPRSYDAWRTAAPPEPPYADHRCEVRDRSQEDADGYHADCFNCGLPFWKAEELWVFKSPEWFCSDECAGEAAHGEKVIRAYEAKADKERVR